MPPERKVVARLNEKRSLTSYIALSADGSLLACANSKHSHPRSESIVIWDLTTKRERKQILRPHEVGALAFSPDGRILASEEDSVVRLWDTATWREKSVLQGHSTLIRALAFAPDGRTLAVADYSKVVLWDVASWTRGARLAGHEGFVQGLAFSPDSRLLVTIGVRGPIQQWSIPNGAALLTIPLPPPGTGPVGFYDVAFSPEGRSFATLGADGVVRFWQIGERTEKARFVLDLSGHALTFSADGKILVICCQGVKKDTGEIQFWNVARRTKIATLPTPEAEPDFIQFLSGKPHLVVAPMGFMSEGIVEIWDVSDILQR
jgi:WD40 repeat protein